MSSFRSKLARLGPGSSVVEHAPSLDDLRARMQVILERVAKREPSAPQPVDTVDLPFATRETPDGPLSIRVQRLSPAHRMGRAPILPSRDASMELLALLALDPSLASCDPRRAIYLDTETTGLQGGAGTVAFLVGLAYFDDTDTERGLVVEQVIVRNLGEEAPMLAHVRDRIAKASMLITFNGKSFDMPLLRTRFVMARIEPPTEPPHLDLVHVARRIHRSRARAMACRLTTIEREVLGFERIGDVPSGEVSACYLHFLRTGDARALLGVVEHNAWDVVAMAALVGLYGEPLLSCTQLAPDDLVGFARTLRRAGALGDALEAVDHAIEKGASVEGYRARGEIAKARGDKARALADFEELARGVDDPSVRLELAKLYEHYVKDPVRALSIAERGTSESGPLAAKRRARLTKKATPRQPDLPGTVRPWSRSR